MSYIPCSLRPPKEVTMKCPECEYYDFFKKDNEKESRGRCMLWKSKKGRLIQNSWTTPSWCPNKEV